MIQPLCITPLNNDFPDPMGLNPGESHRHDHEELWIITRGNPMHSVDFKSEVLESPVVVYISQGKVHSFLPDDQTQGWLIRYRSDFIPQSKFNFYSGFSEKILFPLSHNYCSTTLESLCEIILRESLEDDPDYQVLRHLVIYFDWRSYALKN